MPDQWRRVKLEDVADDVTVGHVGPMTSEYVDCGVPFLRSQNVKPLRVSTEDIKYISQEFHEKIRKSSLHPGDVVIVRTGTPGICAVIPDWLKEANCSDLVIVRPALELDARFLMYYVNTLASHHVAAHLVGAVQQHFNVGSARQIEMLLPSLDEQRAIAGILGSLDDKIELNRRMNQTLEEMAAAIFKAWFVDFEPVKAKAAGAKSFPAMPQPVFDSLPTEFTDSPLGPIPKGWEASTLGDELDICGGGTPSTKTPEFWDGGTHHFATPKDLSQLSSPILLDTARKVTDAGLAKISSGSLPTETLLLSSRAPIGYLAIAKIPVAVNQGFIAMGCQRRLNAPFMLNWCQHYMEDIKSRANGTTFLEVSKKSFRPISIVVPPQPLMDSFADFAAPLYDRVTLNLRESTTLAEIRDALLPKLLSGEIRVGDAETIVGEVA